MDKTGRRVFWAAVIMALPFFASLAAVGQALKAAQEIHFDWAPSQIAVVYRYTLDDYSLLTSAGLERARINGGEGEYSWRRFYPWEIVGTASYSQGGPLGQRMFTGAGGIGYTRTLASYLSPYVRLQAGITRTSSDDAMYLFTAPQWGFTTVASAGLDVRVTPHWGLRAIQVQNEYLPFGSHGSVYWSVGAGVSYRIHP